MIPSDRPFMLQAIRLARKGLGLTSPNPMVGAVLVRNGRIIGSGWHHRAGLPHAEVEALNDAQTRGHPVRGATLYVTLEPCCTAGRTPPCTDAILRSGIRRVVVAAVDRNPNHAGRALPLLEAAGIRVESGLLSAESNRLNESFNHWIVHRTPWVTLKAAMTLDGRIATASGESKWITGDAARREGLKLRKTSDAVMIGIPTLLADDPSLTLRLTASGKPRGSRRRFILDTRARTPLTARVVTDEWKDQTTVIVGESAPARRVKALEQRVRVLKAAETAGRIDLGPLLATLGGEGVTSMLVEGGGEVHAAFLEGGHAHRVAFFYAPILLGGSDSRRAVAGTGFSGQSGFPRLTDLAWRRLGPDLFLQARLQSLTEI